MLLEELIILKIQGHDYIKVSNKKIIKKTNGGLLLVPTANEFIIDGGIAQW